MISVMGMRQSRRWSVMAGLRGKDSFSWAAGRRPEWKCLLCGYLYNLFSFPCFVTCYNISSFSPDPVSPHLPPGCSFGTSLIFTFSVQTNIVIVQRRHVLLINTSALALWWMTDIVEDIRKPLISCFCLCECWQKRHYGFRQEIPVQTHRRFVLDNTKRVEFMIHLKAVKVSHRSFT